MTEALFFGKQACIDTGADKHTAVSEDCYALKLFLAQFVKEVGHALI